MKLIDVAVRPGSPGLRKNGPTLPPGQAQNRSTATPWVGVEAGAAQLHHAALRHDGLDVVGGVVGIAAGGGQTRLPLMLVMLGMPAAAEPCSRAKARLDARKPLSVLTTSTDDEALAQRDGGGNLHRQHASGCWRWA